MTIFVVVLNRVRLIFSKSSSIYLLSVCVSSVQSKVINKMKEPKMFIFHHWTTWILWQLPKCLCFVDHSSTVNSIN